MKRINFRQFADKHNLTLVDLGRDWRSALVSSEYIGAKITSEDEFYLAQSIVDKGFAYFAACKIKQGQGYYEHNQHYGTIYSIDDMREHYEEFLSNDEQVSYYSESEIKERDKFLADHPALEDEDEGEHFNRLLDLAPCWRLVPLYVDESGYWDASCKNLLLADSNDPIFSYSDDDWSRDLILVFKE